MDVDLTIALAVLAVSALVLHYKSHVKFVALGVFIGFVLLDIIPIHTYVKGSVLPSFVEIAFVLFPALVLGINHTVDKRKANTLWTGAFVVVFTLFFLSSLAQFLPPEYSSFVREQSFIGWQVLGYFQWFTLAAAILILADSIPHRHHAEKEKKKKASSGKKKSKSSSS